MTQTVNLLRASEASAHYVYVLFIEGLKYAFTDDNSGGLEGSGASSWIGLSEQRILDTGSATEVVGQREVKRGLVVPGSLRKGSVDPKTMQTQTTTATFEIVDLDDTLLTLFATEGKDRDLLSEYISAGTSDLSTSISVNNQRESVNPRGKHIGLERIGPNGERDFFSPFPGITPGGPEHFWNRFSVNDPSVEPVPVSDDPIQFAGRRAALYRVYGQLDGDQSDASRWPEWSRQYNEGNLVWWGTLRDAGEYVGGDRWKLAFFGPDSLYKKLIGTRTNVRDWIRVHSVNFTYNTDQNEREDEIGVWFTARGVDSTPGFYRYDGSIFHSSHRLTATNVLDLRTEISTVIENTKAGTNTNYTGTGGTLDSPSGGDTNFNNSGPAARLLFGNFGVHRGRSANGWLEMHVVMHEKVWRRIGFDPVRQTALSLSSMDAILELRGQTDVSQNYYGEDIGSTKFVFFRENPGEPPIVADSNLTPGPRYWHAVFTTIAPGTEGSPDQETGSNDGNWREYLPLHPNGTDIFDNRGDFTVELPGNGDIYCQGSRQLGFHGVSINGGTATNQAGLWAFKGKIYRSDGEEEDIIIPAICEWFNSSFESSNDDDGVVDSTEVSGQQAIYVRHVLDPRVFGFQSSPLGNFAWASSEENPMEMRPLSNVAYLWDQNSLERVSDILTTLMLSTGSANGWDGTINSLQTFTVGVNDPSSATGAYTWGGDRMAGSYGLRIPNELMESLDVLAKAWPGSIQDPINRGKLVWFGDVQVFDLIHKLTRPRRVAISLQGNQYGLTSLEEFSQTNVDASIGESDLAGEVGDPAGLIPTQRLRATGFIDQIVLRHGYDPDGGDAVGERIDKALDAGARSRDGTHQMEIDDRLLVHLEPFEFREFQQLTGVAMWGQQWLEMWAVDAAEFYAKRHFMVVDLMVDLLKAQDLQIGAKVALTNPWLITPNGTRGLSNHLGVVMEVEEQLKRRRAKLKVFMHADATGGSVTMYAPAAKLVGYDDTSFVLYCESDFRGIGDSAISDLTGFTKPSWNSDSGSMVVQLVNVTDGSLGPTGTVSSIDTDNDTIQLDGALSASPNVNRDWLVIPAHYDTSGQGDWVKNLYGFMVTDSTKTDSGVKGKEFLP